jgi:hypothetical protein
LGTRDDAQLFGQSRTVRIKQLLGLDGSILAASSTDILPIPRFFIPFSGLQAAAATSCEKSSSVVTQLLNGSASSKLQFRPISLWNFHSLSAGSGNAAASHNLKLEAALRPYALLLLLYLNHS